METSKKLIVLIFMAAILPYISFLSFTGFRLNVLPYIVAPFVATVLVFFFALRREFAALKKLTGFAKNLKEGKWSSRLDSLETPSFGELADAFNIAADRFEKKQNELRQVIDLVPGFIYAKDFDGNIMLANKALSQFLNKEPQEMVGQNESDFEAISFLKNNPLESEVFNDGSLKSISEEDSNVNGKHLTYLVFRSLLVDNKGNRLAILVFAYDITTLKEIQQNLQVLNISLEAKVNEEVEKNILKDKEIIKEKEKFIRNAVHEINSALTVITLNAEYLIKEHGQNRSTSSILGAAKSLSSAYGDLSYSTIKDSSTYQKESNVDVSELLKERIEFFEDIAGLSDILLSSMVEPNAMFLFNKAKLTRLIDNNLSNAIKYSHPQKSVFVRFFQDAGKWTLEFESVGKKIEDKSKIFELYTREDGIKGGHGVGLSMVKEICDECGVDIEVDTDGNKNVFRYRFNKNC
jgi:PAS domain S-box-containing protein